MVCVSVNDFRSGRAGRAGRARRCRVIVVSIWLGWFPILSVCRVGARRRRRRHYCAPHAAVARRKQSARLWRLGLSPATRPAATAIDAACATALALSRREYTRSRRVSVAVVSPWSTSRRRRKRPTRSVFASAHRWRSTRTASPRRATRDPALSATSRWRSRSACRAQVRGLGRAGSPLGRAAVPQVRRAGAPTGGERLSRLVAAGRCSSRPAGGEEDCPGAPQHRTRRRRSSIRHSRRSSSATSPASC